MAADDERDILRRAGQQCRRLIEQLRRDAADLAGPAKSVPPEALAAGRAAYERAADAAEALLKELHDSTHRE